MNTARKNIDGEQGCAVMFATAFKFTTTNFYGLVLKKSLSKFNDMAPYFALSIKNIQNSGGLFYLSKQQTLNLCYCFYAFFFHL